MIKGNYYLAGSSNFLPATLYIQAGSYQIHIKDQPIISGSINQLTVSDRLGHIPRKITLPDGSVFDTPENDAIDSLLARQNQASRWLSIVHALEQNMLLAIISIFFVAGVVFSGFKWGLPAASESIAKSLPASTNQMLAENVLEFLDDSWLSPSQLSESKQAQIRQHFSESIIPLYTAEDSPKFKLHFRLWPMRNGGSIPNALALPSGDIIVTDRFIELAENQDQIDIVLLHEMGHVVGRHSLEQVIEGSAVAIAVSIAFGDVSWLADMGVGVGSFLVSSFYSRNHEAQADKFAYEHSLIAGINPTSLGEILMLMEQDMASHRRQRADDGGQKEEISEYFSTHPSSSKRAEIGKHYLRCFEQGIIKCPDITIK